MSNESLAIKYYNQGCDLLKSKDDANALKEFEKAIEFDPTLIVAFVNAGNCLRRLSRYDESAYYCLKAIELDKESRLAHFNYGCTLCCMGLYQNAISEFDIVLPMRPNDPEILLQLARCYICIEMPRKGIYYLAQAIRLKPFDSECHQLLSQTIVLLFCNGVIKIARK